MLFEHLGDAYLKNNLVERGDRGLGEVRSRWTRTNRPQRGVKKKLQETRENQLRVKGDSRAKAEQK